MKIKELKNLINEHEKEITELKKRIILANKFEGKKIIIIKNSCNYSDVKKKIIQELIDKQKIGTIEQFIFHESPLLEIRFQKYIGLFDINEIKKIRR